MPTASPRQTNSTTFNAMATHAATLSPSTPISKAWKNSGQSVQSPSGHWKVKSPQSNKSNPSVTKSPSGNWTVHNSPCSKRKALPPKKKLVSICIGGIDIEVVEKSRDQLYLNCKDIWTAIGLAKVVSARGYSQLDKILQKEGIKKDVAFLFTGKRRSFVRLDAVLTIIDKWKGRGKWNVQSKQKMSSAKDELLALVPHIKISSLEARKRLTYTSKNPRHVNASPKNNTSPATVLRKTLLSMFNHQFQGSRTALMKGLCGLYRPNHSKKFNGFLSSNDLKSILSSVPPSRKTGKYRAKNMLEEIAIDTFKSSRALKRSFT